MNALSKIEISDPVEVTTSTRFEVRIDNVNNRNAAAALKEESRQELLEIFPSYWINYPGLKILINKHELKFDPVIKDSEEKLITVQVTDTQHEFVIKVDEMLFEGTRRCFLCNKKGIPFKEINPGLQ